MLAIGIGSESAVAVMLAGSLLVGMAGAFAWTMPLGARLRAQRLELTWWHTHAESRAARGAVVTGVPFEIRASLRHRGTTTLVVRELTPALAAHVRCVQGRAGDLVLVPGTRTDFELTLITPAAGRVVLHGLSLTVPGPFDLFRAPLYFPSPLVVKALPRMAARTSQAIATSPTLAVERVGRTQRRTRGGGTDLHEIRELVPGDPFKAIAWKASAKTGRLMVREVESEVQETLYVVLDVGGSMRGGTPGSRKLDHAIELATLAAREALERGDRVGVITVDGRILAHARARDGVAHLPALQEVLLAALEVVDRDLTEPDDEELVAIVARYVRTQDGLSFAAVGGIDIDGLVRHAALGLAAEREPREGSHHELVASDRRTKILRRYCRARGIPLRYRAETRGFAKASGLAKALSEAAGKTRVPRSILFITDFDGVFEPEPLLKTLRLLRTQGHSLAAIFPDARSMVDVPQGPLLSDLHLVYGLGEERRLQDARSFLGKLGIPLRVSAQRSVATNTATTLTRAQTRPWHLA
jgi:uncharacterized protein (DUF58 family)